MQLPAHTTSIFMFLITSLLSWFLKLIFLFQIEFFFICIEFFLKEKFFNFYKQNKTICFILIYLVFIIYYTVFICFFQIFFIFFIYTLKKTTFKAFSATKNKGMLYTSFTTINLYNPVLLLKPYDNTLLVLQSISKFFYFFLFFFILNIFL